MRYENSRSGIDTNAPQHKAQIIFNEKQDFIFNPDLDGILAAGFLKKILGWKEVGVAACNGDAEDAIWTTQQNKRLSDSVFIDIWINPPEIKVIDQHITAFDEEHHALLSSNKNKFNPNLLWPRYVLGKGPSEYRWKYPFGVVHFIIASLESIGHTIKIDNNQIQGFNTFDLLLRADDAAFSTADKYRANSLNWWDRLKRLGGQTTRILADYAITQDKVTAAKTKLAVEDWLQKRRLPITQRGPKDGGFSAAIKQQNSWTKSMDDYSNELLSALSLPALQIEPQLIKHRLHGNRIKPEDGRTKDILIHPKLFTYAFTGGINNRSPTPGFSYSLSDAE